MGGEVEGEGLVVNFLVFRQIGALGEFTAGGCGRFAIGEDQLAVQECLEDRWLRTEFSDHRFEFRFSSTDADRFDQRRGFIESFGVGCIAGIDG